MKTLIKSTLKPGHLRMSELSNIEHRIKLKAEINEINRELCISKNNRYFLYYKRAILIFLHQIIKEAISGHKSITEISRGIGLREETLTKILNHKNHFVSTEMEMKIFNYLNG